MKTFKYWIEAMRLRTLPVSVAGVITAIALAVMHGVFDVVPAVICLCFAVLAQIASNFANEYFDYTAHRDRPGREGPRRGVTEGEITPSAMKKAIYITLLLAGCLGLSLVGWGGWRLIAIGAAIGVGVFAYSAGPYPLSTHGWGEVGVVLFFGIVPVNFTYYVQALAFPTDVFLGSVAVGLMGANVLIVNNYRDMEDDEAVCKRTLCVKLGRRAMLWLYALDAVVACALLWPVWEALGEYALFIPAVYWVLAMMIVRRMSVTRGAALTPMLGITAMLMFAVSAAILIFALV